MIQIFKNSFPNPSRKPFTSNCHKSERFVRRAETTQSGIVQLDWSYARETNVSSQR
jgi:hypothetical protein